jgi:hypothetical protein
MLQVGSQKHIRIKKKKKPLSYFVISQNWFKDDHHLNYIAKLIGNQQTKNKLKIYKIKKKIKTNSSNHRLTHI